jgi:beta-N-acetylhexosaminidase
MTDDIGMQALSGPLGDRAQAAITAGCDVVLHGSERLQDHEAIAETLDPIGGAARRRLARAMDRIADRSSAHRYEALAAKRDALLAYA